MGDKYVKLCIRRNSNCICISQVYKLTRENTGRSFFANAYWESLKAAGYNVNIHNSEERFTKSFSDLVQSPAFIQHMSDCGFELITPVAINDLENYTFVMAANDADERVTDGEFMADDDTFISPINVHHKILRHILREKFLLNLKASVNLQAQSLNKRIAELQDSSDDILPC